uniref:Uncharacterized protein n=1 Tax=Candidatus Kentrum sp. DK TaxID=2126562 RepID=A0A450SCK1_9GAMM|nr:MAG: hypothetical protein BECKDK2373C_GA0170839_102729 [Candidatus Kentron sp. DK]
MSENSKNRKEELEQANTESVSEERSNPSLEDRYSWDDPDDPLDGIETTDPDKGKPDSSPDDSLGSGHKPKTQDEPEIGETGIAPPISSSLEWTRSETVPEEQGLPQVASENASPKSYTGPYSRLRIPPEKPKRASFESEENKPHRTENTSHGDPLDDTPFPRIDSERLDESDIGQTEDDQKRSRPSIDLSRLSSSRADQEPPSIRPVREDGNIKRRRGDTEKLAIVGGKMTGKSYLFQSMVHRLAGVEGSMGYFLNAGTAQLHELAHYGDTGQSVTPDQFLTSYRQWYRLEFTQHKPIWYQLNIPFSAGILGFAQPEIEINYLEASGEGFFEQAMHGNNVGEWEAFLDVKTIVFCLPLWAAFPGRKMTQEDWVAREGLLQGLGKVADHFASLLRTHNRKRKTRTILALTMADDRRGGLSTLRENWIDPHMQDDSQLRESLGSANGIIRYLANTQRVSEIVRKEMERSSDIRIRSLPKRIKFGHQKTWFIPMTAIHGDTLDRMEQEGQEVRAGIRAPVPVHVELPLLVALSDGRQALM